METKKTTIPTIEFLKCKKPLNLLGITDEEINKALNDLNITKKDLVEEYNVPIGSKFHCSSNEFVKTGPCSVKKYYQEYEKTVTERRDIYIAPATYQGLKHGEIIYKILSNRYPWMDNFQKDKSYKEAEIEVDSIGRLDLENLPSKYDHLTIKEVKDLVKKKDVVKKESSWSLYEMYNSIEYEIYLTTEFGSLYVPIKALIEKNFKLINDRMVSYANSYHDPKGLSRYALNNRGRTLEEYAKDKQADYINMIRPLESKEALILKILLT
jgi:hypothetical protein